MTLLRRNESYNSRCQQQFKATYGNILPVSIAVILSLIWNVFTWALQDLPPREKIYGISGVLKWYASGDSDMELKTLGAGSRVP